MLGLRKCQPCSTLDFKGVENKMAMYTGIFRETILTEISEKVDFLQISCFL